MNKEEKVRSLNKKILIIDALIAVFAVCLVVSVIGYIKQKLIATAASVEYEDVRVEAVVGEHESINFSTVKSAGSTSTSWLYIPGTMIDYPLVQGPNNDYYLDTDAYGNKSQAGAIFINFANAPDMSDAKTVIFGHNMTNRTMFTDLHKYADENFGKVHQDAYIYMESGEVKHYKLLYYLFTQPLEPSVYVVSKADVALEEANLLKEKADIVYADATGGNLICLSTCTAHKYRTVVVFEYVDNAKPITGSLKMTDEALEGIADNVGLEEDTAEDSLPEGPLNDATVDGWIKQFEAVGNVYRQDGKIPEDEIAHALDDICQIASNLKDEQIVTKIDRKDTSVEITFANGRAYTWEAEN